MLASEVVSRVRALLQDPSAVRWTDSELLLWVAEGQQMIATLRPDSTAQVSDLVMVANAHRATLASNHRRLLDVLGTSDGYTVTRVDVSVLDRHAPNWRREKATRPEHYLYEERDPTVVQVYPSPKSDVTLRVLVSVTPDSSVAASDTIVVDDSYVATLVDLVMSRALEKETAAANIQKGQAYRQSAMARLQGATGSDAANSPATNEDRIEK